jgi:tryptophan-rich sensory protein
MKNALALLLFLLASVATASFGALFSPGDWYQSLLKPAWTPPPWLFGPVWSLLYAMIAVSGWLVWRSEGWSGARLALTVFSAQLVLNALWSWLFFGLQRPDLALIDIVLLEATILWMVVLFWPISWLAGALLLPYLVWVAFATALNGAIWQLNP